MIGTRITLKRTAALALGLWVVVGLAGTRVAADPVAPTLASPPDGYEALGPGSGMLLLQWDAVGDAWAYEVRISQEAEEFEDYIRFAMHPRLSFGTSEEGTFGWQVRCLYADPDAECASAEATYGPWSDVWTFSVVKEATGGGLAPHRPEVEFPGNGNALVEGSNYRFCWRKTPGAYQYQVCLETPSGTQCQIVNGESWQFRTARWAGPRHGADHEEGTYQLRVRAIGEGGTGEWCDPIQFDYNYGGDHGTCWGPVATTIDPPDLIAPPDESTLDPTPEGLLGEFSWSEVEGAIYYEIKFQDTESHPGGSMQGPMHHGIADPPTSVLTEEPTYALVIPEAVAGERYSWKVRAIIQEGENLLPTEFSETWHFIIGEVEEPPESGEALALLSVENGTEYPGPQAALAFAWNRSGTEGLCLVSVSDATQNRVAMSYRRGASWEAEIPGFGQYTWRVRRVDIGGDGSVVGMGPASEQRQFQVKGQVPVEGGRRLGDLVNDGEVDSGDAIRALRHSADQDQVRLTVRDTASGDCNGDGRVDSGDAVYMLRKAVGSNR